MAPTIEPEESEDAGPKRKRWALDKDEEALVKIREVLADLGEEQVDMVLTWVLRKWKKIGVTVSS